ncbi:MAG: MBL fold metallo-hydrolase [Alphaproteobacteria bacterium]|nr:MBL fold metallo-hydrolase [Alphaproteobacteria bacterium]
MHGIELHRLNEDSSWVMTVDGTRLLVDPWLDGPAVIGVPSLHIAHHTGPTVAPSALPEVDALLISHPFPDHLHRDTLAQLPRDLPAYAPRVATTQVRWVGGLTRVTALPDVTAQAARGARPAPIRIGRAEVWYLRAASLFDPTHNGVVIRGADSGATVLYAPHGLMPGATVRAVEQLTQGRLDVVMTSFTFLDLPFYLGGIANLGREAALGLTARLRPRFLVSTHDGAKTEGGFIATVSKATRCDDVPAALASRGLTPQAVAPGVGERWSVGATA